MVTKLNRPIQVIVGVRLLAPIGESVRLQAYDRVASHETMMTMGLGKYFGRVECGVGEHERSVFATKLLPKPREKWVLLAF